MKPLLASVCIAAALVGAPAQAENMNFNFINPNFGGVTDNGAFLFGLADAQRTATIGDDGSSQDGGDADAPIPGVGGTNVGGPTIVIPITPGSSAPPPNVGIGGNGNGGGGT